jgi:hypothetical protein
MYSLKHWDLRAFYLRTSIHGAPNSVLCREKSAASAACVENTGPWTRNGDGRIAGYGEAVCLAERVRERSELLDRRVGHLPRRPPSRSPQNRRQRLHLRRSGRRLRQTTTPEKKVLLTAQFVDNHHSRINYY